MVAYDGGTGSGDELDEPHALSPKPLASAPAMIIRLMVTGYHSGALLFREWVCNVGKLRWIYEALI
jgi:hypothetical protein